MFKKLALSAAVAATMGCAPAVIDAGEEGVLIYKPWIFGHGGVDEDPIKTGLTWRVFSTSVETFWITPRRYDEEFDDIISADNTPVDFDGYLTLKIIEGKSPILLEKFQVNWYQHNIQKIFRALLRDQANLYTVDELTSDTEIRKSIKAVTLKGVTSHLENIGLPVEVVEVEIGRVIPPEEVLAETERTAAAKQRVKTEQAQKIAEDARKARENSRATADKEYMREMGFDNNQYLTSRSIEIEREKLEIIKGKDNVHVILSSGAGAAQPQPMFKVD